MQMVYTLFNLGARAGASAAGWAVPMATDIAFAMGVFGFFKSRMPAGAEAFLLTLATVDDLGAIAVIAVLCAALRRAAGERHIARCTKERVVCAHGLTHHDCASPCAVLRAPSRCRT